MAGLRKVLGKEVGPMILFYGCRHVGGKDFLVLVDGVEDLVYARGAVRVASQKVADRLADLAVLLG